MFISKTKLEELEARVQLVSDVATAAFDLVTRVMDHLELAVSFDKDQGYVVSPKAKKKVTKKKVTKKKVAKKKNV